MTSEMIIQFTWEIYVYVGAQDIFKDKKFIEFDIPKELHMWFKKTQQDKEEVTTEVTGCM